MANDMADVASFDVTFLALLPIDDPKDEVGIESIMAGVANRDSAGPEIVMDLGSTSVQFSAPTVDSLPPELDCEITFTRIVFFVRGDQGAETGACFAFTALSKDKSDGGEKRKFVANVFRCATAEDVGLIFGRFSLAFRRNSSSDVSTVDLQAKLSSKCSTAVKYDVAIDIREERIDSDRPANGSPSTKSFDLAPFQRGTYRLRSNVAKKVVVSIVQHCPTNHVGKIDRCFGILVNSGRDIESDSTQFLDNIQLVKVEPDKIILAGILAASAKIFDSTPHESSPMVIAIDLVLIGVAEPVRLTVHARAKIQPDRLWPSLALPAKAQLTRNFILVLAQTDSDSLYEVVDVKSSDATPTNLGSQEVRPSTFSRRSLSSHFASLMNSSVMSSIGESLRQSSAAYYASYSNGSISQQPIPVLDVDGSTDGESSGDEEPVLSGFGQISKDCSTSELEMWSRVLKDWPTDASGGSLVQTARILVSNGDVSGGGGGEDDKSQHLSGGTRDERATISIQSVPSMRGDGCRSRPLVPSQMPVLVAYGIPDALRGELWQRLALNSCQMAELVDAYRLLVGRDSPYEKIIMRDISRTFPAHDFFKEAGGIGQEVLYRIAKAFSIFDPEVGYCQGQSFLIAALALQMPEEQAFAVLVAIMYSLNLREIFLQDFDLLQMRLYQLDCLIRDQLPDLHQHLADAGLETHMFASQWFLTVFSAKFPLFLVFRVVDVFLTLGMDALFRVALAILHVANQDLLSLDFEGMMKYFRVNLPKRYRNESCAKSLMMTAVNRVHVKTRKMRRYESDWRKHKAAQLAMEDPVNLLRAENRRLTTNNVRLDAENDILATQLVTSRIEMQRQIDTVEEERDSARRDQVILRQTLAELEDRVRLLTEENSQLKAMILSSTALASGQGDGSDNNEADVN